MPAASERRVIRIIAFPRGRSTGTVQAVEAAFRTLLPEVDFKSLPYDDVVKALAAVQFGEADLTFVNADAVYAAYVGELDRTLGAFDRLRGLGTLSSSSVHLLASDQSGIRRIEDMRGRRLRIGIEKTNPFTPRLVLAAFGIELAASRTEVLDFRDGAAIHSLTTGTLDAMFINATPSDPTVTAAVSGGARLVSISGPVVQQLLREYPFFQLMLLRGGAYANHPHATRTIGIRPVAVCRNDLPEALGYMFTKQLVEGLRPASWEEGRSTPFKLTSAPATPIPLHEGAARYYRERELFR